MKNLKTKMLVIALLAIVCIGVASSYASGMSPAEMACSVMQSDVSLAALAVSPVAFTIPSINFKNLKVVTQDEFAKLQAKHGKLYVLDIQLDEDESYQYISKRPTRSLLSAIADSKDDLEKANDLILKNMLVAGDMKALDDGVVYGQVMKELGRIMQQGNSFLSKA